MRQANIALKARSLEHFSRKLSIFGRFWGPFGNQIGLQNGSQYYKIGFWFHLGAPGRSKGPFWVDLGTHLGAFGDHFESSGGHFGTIFEVWQQQKKQTEANQSKNNTQWEKLAGNRSQQQHAAANTAARRVE